MDFEKEITEAIKKSSPEIKRLMFSNDFGTKIQDIAWENSLDEDMALKLADEVGYVVLGLKQRLSFENSLTKMGIDKNKSTKIAKEIGIRVFTELDKINEAQKKNMEIEKKEVLPEIKTSVKETEKPEEKEKSSGVGNSFEQAIINQAKAMRPVPAAPINLPTEEKPAIAEDYKPGADPYREPLE